MRPPDVILVFGTLSVMVSAVTINVIWPVRTMDKRPSRQWAPTPDLAEQGRQRYIANGCTYCHSQYVRPQDWGRGAERIAEAGDYFMQLPHLLGSERTGPDLSQEGGVHSDDWHLAHFVNPRHTSPRSLMPAFEFEGEDNVKALIAYTQSLGGKRAIARMAVQNRWGPETRASAARGDDAQIEWLHSRVPLSWRAMPTESTVSRASVKRGEKVYLDFCIGCHGPVGDGNGPAAPYLNPKPVNFTVLRRHLIEGKFIGGIIYYQVMNGVTGSAMPFFKKDLESAKIWDVTNFIEYEFIGHRGDTYPSVGIPPAYEGDEAGPVTPTAPPAESGTAREVVDELP